VAAILAAAGLGAGAFARTPLPIYGAAFLAGAGTSTWRVATGPLLMRLTTERTRERAFSWNVALLLGFGAAWTAAAGAAPGWLEQALGLGPIGGLRAGLFFGALGTLLSLILFALLPASSDSRGAVAAPARLPAPAARAGAMPEDAGLSLALLGLILVVAVWMAAGGLVIPFLNLYFMREHGWAVARIGLLFAAAQAVTALIVVASGDLAARFGARRMLLLWALPFAPLLWGLSVAGPTQLAIGLFLFQGFVPPATNPLIDQLLLERAPPGRQGAISTGRNAATEVAGLVGASGGGALLQATGFGALFGVAGAVALAGSLGLLLAFRRASSERSVPAP
jgi:predicted MFS family arabinose efflux permease